VLHVGRITPRKSIDKLVESFENIKNGRNDYKLVLVGKETMDEYSQTVRKKASNDVILTGFVEDEVPPDSTTAAMFMQRARSPRAGDYPLRGESLRTTIVAYDSIPAVRSIDNAVLATDGDQPDFEEKLKTHSRRRKRRAQIKRSRNSTMST